MEIMLDIAIKHSNIEIIDKKRINSFDELSKIPNSSGVYIIINMKSRDMFIGYSSKIRDALMGYRSMQYRKNSTYDDPAFVNKGIEIYCFITKNWSDAFNLADHLFREIRPTLNKKSILSANYLERKEKYDIQKNKLYKLGLKQVKKTIKKIIRT